MLLCYSSIHGYNHKVQATQVYLSPSGALRCLCEECANKADGSYDKPTGWTYVENARIENGEIKVYDLANVPMKPIEGKQ